MGILKNNEYDNPEFFRQYAGMPRSRQGLSGAGEWNQFKEILPEFAEKSVLDLGCGYGWHCKYAAAQGARNVLGLDLSAKMLEEAARRNSHKVIQYQLCSLEDYEYPENCWDVVISNLALHYIKNLDRIFRNIHKTLKTDGVFVFNIEHPVFTAAPGQEWIRDGAGKPLYWPVDNYFYPGERKTNFLGCEILKEHHTLTQIVMGLLNNGFALEALEEAQPPGEMMDIPGMADEMRRPMMLLVRARACADSLL